LIGPNLAGGLFALSFAAATSCVVAGIIAWLPAKGFWPVSIVAVLLIASIISLTLWWLRLTVTKALQPIFADLSFQRNGIEFLRNSDLLSVRVGRLLGLPMVYLRWTVANPTHREMSIQDVLPLADANTRKVLSDYLGVPSVRILDDRIEYWSYVVMDSPFRPAKSSAALIRDAAEFLTRLCGQLNGAPK
jgi:hypothetical protein